MGAVLFGFALSSTEAVKLTSVIRYESYFNAIINTNYFSNNLPSEMEVTFRGTGKKKILPLKGKILLHKADRYDLFNDISELHTCMCFSIENYVRVMCSLPMSMLPMYLH